MSCNNCFALTLSVDENFALKGKVIDELYLWHLKYEHLNYKSLKLLKDKIMILGLLDVAKINKIC